MLDEALFEARTNVDPVFSKLNKNKKMISWVI
jgi:hypothetical protein